MTDKLLLGKVAIITGASRGIGKAIAIKFAEQGADLVLISRSNKEKMMSVCDLLDQKKTRYLKFLGDVSDAQFTKKICDKVIKQFGQIDILVNSAGTIARSPFEEMTLEDWHSVVDVNLNGAMNMCKSVINSMLEAKSGKIINLTSQMAFMPHPAATPSYEVSKSGLTALTRHLAKRYADKNIYANSIAPGSIDTDMPKSMSKEARQRLKDAVPMKRLGEVEEVADCALFLASNMSSYITGQTIHINGGSLII